MTSTGDEQPPPGSPGQWTPAPWLKPTPAAGPSEPVLPATAPPMTTADAAADTRSFPAAAQQSEVDPDQAVATGGPPGKVRKPRNWMHRGRQLALAGVVVLLLGILLVGAGLGWTARTLTASPADTESTVQVVEAPSGSDSGVVVMPDVRGLETVDATQALADAGLGSSAVTLVDRPSAQPAGTVVDQDPVGGTSGATEVTVYVAVTGAIPELVGTDGSAAIQTLVELGVNAAVTEVFDPASPEGLVLALDPPAGSPLTEDVTVTVAGPPGSLYLDELDAQNGCSTGASNVNGTTYQHSLSCSASATPRSTTYLLNRRTVQLTGLLGVGDTSDNDYVGTVVVRGDGQQLFTAQVVYGAVVPFTVPTGGVLQLQIEYSLAESDDRSPSGNVVIADPRLVGSPAEIDLLASQ